MNSTTLNEIARNILNTMRGGRSSQSEHISLEQIKYTVKYYRALFIRRDFQRNFNRYRMFEQDLGHLSTEVIDSAEDSSINSGNLVMKTVNQIPTPIRMKRFEGITYVSESDKVGEEIPLLDGSRIPWTNYNKYTSDNVHATYRGGYIYVFNDVSIQNIHVRGVFEDPEEVYNFVSDNSIDVYDGNQSFPISIDMIEGITKGILRGELKLLASTPNDEELDHQQDSNPQQ